MAIFAEPPATKWDVRFKLGRIPVRVHPFFWVSTIALALRPPIDAVAIAAWVVAVLVSILVHELGHAVAFRRFGCEARITLYGFGGLATGTPRADSARPAPRARVAIAAAGPLAGFAFAAVVVCAVVASGHAAPLAWWTLGGGAPIPSAPLELFVSDLGFVNVVWGLVNLLPVHPLDGGEIALELARARDPRRGEERSLWLSLAVATLAAALGIALLRDWFIAVLFGYLAFMSWRVLRLRFGARMPRLPRPKRAPRERLSSPEVDRLMKDVLEKVEKARVRPKD